MSKLTDAMATKILDVIIPTQVRCDLCSRWNKPNARKVAPHGQGHAPIAQLIANGVKIDPATVMTVSECTAQPLWAMTTDDHYCAMFQHRLDA